MGIVASEGFSFLLDPGLRKVFFDEYNLPESQVDKLYGMEKSGKAVEFDLGVGGLGDLEEFTGTIPYDDFRQQFRTSYTHKEYVKGVKVERKLVDDDLYNVINNRPRTLAMVAKRTREKHGASVFNHAFNTSVFTGGDTFALCANAHTFNGTSTTQDNLLTTALSATSVATARLNMRAFLDETDNIVNAMGDTLVVPPELEETAFEIVKTNQQVDSANNNANFHMGRYKVIVWDYLNDSDNWFLVDSRFAKTFLKWFDRIPIEFNKDKDFDTYIAKWSAYNRYSFGFSDWRWVIGNQVS